MFNNLLKALAAKCNRGNWALLVLALFITSIVSLQACTPLNSTAVSLPANGSPDENPKRRYDLNYKLTGYFNNADYSAIKAEYDRLAKEEGDGNTITCFNTDKDMQCKLGGCHDPGTEIIERPGWEDENRTIASRKGPPHLSYAERKAWYDKVKADNEK